MTPYSIPIPEMSYLELRKAILTKKVIRSFEMTINPKIRQASESFIQKILINILGKLLPELTDMKSLSQEMSIEDIACEFNLQVTSSDAKGGNKKLLFYLTTSKENDMESVSRASEINEYGSCVYQWFMDDKIVTIYQRIHDLSYRLIYKNQRKDRVGPINFESDNRTIEERILFLSECLPVELNDATLSFSNPLICHTWKVKTSKIMDDSQIHHFEEVPYRIFAQRIEERELSLIRMPNDVLWCLFDAKHKCTIYTSFKKSTSTSTRCSDETREFIKELKKSSLEDIISFIKDFTVPELKIFPLSEPSPFKVYLEPKTAKSCIDERIMVSQFQWAVTLVTHNGSEGNHAHIIVEGITNDKRFLTKDNHEGYFMHQSHFTGSRVKSKPQDSRKLKYEERTPMWKVSSQKAVRMLEDIAFEKDNDRAPLFSKVGCDSIFSRSGEHSCFTWAREKLEILGVDLGRSLLGWAFTRTKNYTNPKDEYFKLPKHLSCIDYKII